MSIKPTHQFQKKLYILATGLACLCCTLMLLTWLQGPRIRSSLYDAAKVTLAPSQRLTLQLNQAVPAITEKQVTVTPSTPVKATSDGKTIIVQFSKPLLNSTAYTVRVRLPGNHTLHYGFKTIPASIYYAVDSDGISQIYRKQLGGNHTDTLLFGGGQIDDYAVLNGTLVLVQRHENKDLLSLYNPVTHSRKEIALPEPGIVTSLQPAPDGRSFGFIFTATDYTSGHSNTLMIYDVAKHVLRPVTGFDDQPVKTTDWVFAKDSKTIAALGFDSILLLIPPNAAPFPLGQFTSVAGFNYDSTALYVGTLDGPQTLALKTTQKQRVHTGNGLYILAARPFNAGNGALLRVNDTHAGTSKETLMVTQGGKDRRLYNVPNGDGFIADTTLSPNDQYAALELRAGTSLQTKATIIDTATGKPLALLPGGTVRWSATAP